MLEDRLPTRPLVSRAVRLLSQPRRSPADSALVTGVALRLAALDSDSETADKLIAASDRVIVGVAGLVGEPAPQADWSDTAEALALMIAGRPLQRRHLMASRSALGSADKVLDLSDRLRRTAEEDVDRDDLGRALAMAVAAPAEMVDALIEQEKSSTRGRSDTAGHGREATEPRPPGPGPRASRPAPGERGVPLRALDGGIPGR
ncbi:MAG TPA: hypothetical protein VFG96_01375 [Jiangellaceae bacterium]|nr:hypothetical protein [Jiangellaceae bacterium]